MELNVCLFIFLIVSKKKKQLQNTMRYHKKRKKNLFVFNLNLTFLACSFITMNNLKTNKRTTHLKFYTFLSNPINQV